MDQQAVGSQSDNGPREAAQGSDHMKVGKLGTYYVGRMMSPGSVTRVKATLSPRVNATT